MKLARLPVKVGAGDTAAAAAPAIYSHRVYPGLRGDERVAAT